MRVSFNPFSNQQFDLQTNSFFSTLFYRIGVVVTFAFGCLAIVATYAIYKWSFKKGEVKKGRQLEKKHTEEVPPKPNQPNLDISNKKASLPTKEAKPQSQTHSPEQRGQIPAKNTIMQPRPQSSSLPEVKKREPARKVPMTTGQVYKGFNSGKISNQHKAYRDDQLGCRPHVIQAVFLGIQSTIPKTQGESKEPDLSSVVGLLQFVSDSTVIDLHNAKAEQAVLDVIKNCNKEKSLQLVKWLLIEKTFHVKLLVSLLEAFIERDSVGQPIDIYAVELLIKFYQENKWKKPDSNTNEETSIEYPAEYSASNPQIVSAMTLIIKKDVHNDKVIAWVGWMLQKNDYDLKIFCEWIRVFYEKEQTHPDVAGTLQYNLLNFLIKEFQLRYQDGDIQVIVNHLVAHYQNSEDQNILLPDGVEIYLQGKLMKGDKSAV